ncbi:SDR family oxidoreductase [Marinicella pacifica]|uniref:SDR family oxidoreductase n=1 Tax=Marinicella pacifica TaxID=1171543 RepID=A0A917FSY9_9GAMM|nr:SDR family NAD(P)-dependent oxidoreductase [Marinicella pacifica]GGF99175.1 SDR family oxidoreductase [Marinicella pacifica]
MYNVLIIGGNQGIGLAMAERYRTQGHHVITTSRQFSKNQTSSQQLYCDLTHPDSIVAAFDHLQTEITHIDVLINCAGVLHTENYQPEKSLKQVQADNFQHNYQVNAIGHLLVLQQAEQLLSHSKQAVAVSISARIGSIEDNHLGGWYAYRMSKAALNMGVKTLSIEWQRKYPNIQCLLLHPGTTDTALSKPFQQRLPEGQLQTVDETAEMLQQQIEQNTHTTNQEALFLDYAGKPIPW